METLEVIQWYVERLFQFADRLAIAYVRTGFKNCIDVVTRKTSHFVESVCSEFELVHCLSHRPGDCDLRILNGRDDCVCAIFTLMDRSLKRSWWS